MTSELRDQSISDVYGCVGEILVDACEADFVVLKVAGFDADAAYQFLEQNAQSADKRTEPEGDCDSELS